MSKKKRSRVPGTRNPNPVARHTRALRAPAVPDVAPGPEPLVPDPEPVVWEPLTREEIGGIDPNRLLSRWQGEDTPLECLVFGVEPDYDEDDGPHMRGDVPSELELWTEGDLPRGLGRREGDVITIDPEIAYEIATQYVDERPINVLGERAPEFGPADFEDYLMERGLIEKDGATWRLSFASLAEAYLYDQREGWEAEEAVMEWLATPPANQPPLVTIAVGETQTTSGSYYWPFQVDAEELSDEEREVYSRARWPRLGPR